MSFFVFIALSALSIGVLYYFFFIVKTTL